MRSVESSCRVHEIPNSDVAGSSLVAGRSRVKYEKSSSDLSIYQHESLPDYTWHGLYLYVFHGTGGPVLELTRVRHRSMP